MMWIKIIPFVTAYLFECVAISSASTTTVSAFVGMHALLPCGYGEELLIWQDQEGEVVASYKKGSSSQANHPKFTNRTQLFSKGNGSLLILGVKVSDNGHYTCYRRDPPGPLREEFVNLEVVANYSTSCSRHKTADEWICKALGGYPKGNIYWLQDGQTLNSSVPSTNQDASSLLFNLTSTLKGPSGVKCVVEIPGQTISVNCSEDTDPEKNTSVDTSDSSDSRWAIGVSVISTLVVALCVLAVWLNSRRKSARVSEDHVKGENELDEAEECPLKGKSGKDSAEGRAHQCKTDMIAES